MSNMSPPHPRVGIGVLVVRDDCVLLGRRRGSHGAGDWAPPGGHLEFGETIAAGAAREVLEETGLVLTATIPGPYTEDVFVDAGRHYLTVFVVARAPVGTPIVREPTKCDGWAWVPWAALPSPLFAPLASLVATGFDPIAALAGTE